MRELYPVPADDGRTMFLIYSTLTYFMAGMTGGVASLWVGYPGLLLSPIFGILASNWIRNLERKADRRASDN